jgi:hypothetical protein
VERSGVGRRRGGFDEIPLCVQQPCTSAVDLRGAGSGRRGRRTGGVNGHEGRNHEIHVRPREDPLQIAPRTSGITGERSGFPDGAARLTSVRSVGRLRPGALPKPMPRHCLRGAGAFAFPGLLLPLSTGVSGYDPGRRGRACHAPRRAACPPHRTLSVWRHRGRARDGLSIIGTRVAIRCVTSGRRARPGGRNAAFFGGTRRDLYCSRSRQ